MSFGKQPSLQQTSVVESSRSQEEAINESITDDTAESGSCSFVKKGQGQLQIGDHVTRGREDAVKLGQPSHGGPGSPAIGGYNRGCDGKRSRLHRSWGSTGPVSDIPSNPTHPPKSGSRVGLRRAWSASYTKSRRNSDQVLIERGGDTVALGAGNISEAEVQERHNSGKCLREVFNESKGEGQTNVGQADCNNASDGTGLTVTHCNTPKRDNAGDRSTNELGLSGGDCCLLVGGQGNQPRGNTTDTGSQPIPGSEGNRVQPENTRSRDCLLVTLISEEEEGGGNVVCCRDRQSIECIGGRHTGSCSHRNRKSGSVCKEGEEGNEHYDCEGVRQTGGPVQNSDTSECLVVSTGKPVLVDYLEQEYQDHDNSRSPDTCSQSNNETATFLQCNTNTTTATTQAAGTEGHIGLTLYNNCKQVHPQQPPHKQLLQIQQQKQQQKQSPRGNGRHWSVETKKSASNDKSNDFSSGITATSETNLQPSFNSTTTTWESQLEPGPTKTDTTSSSRGGNSRRVNSARNILCSIGDQQGLSAAEGRDDGIRLREFASSGVSVIGGGNHNGNTNKNSYKLQHQPINEEVRRHGVGIGGGGLRVSFDSWSRSEEEEEEDNKEGTGGVSVGGHKTTHLIRRPNVPPQQEDETRCLSATSDNINIKDTHQRDSLILDNSDTSGCLDIHSSQDFYIEDSYTEATIGGGVVVGLLSPPPHNLGNNHTNTNRSHPLITVDNSCSSCDPSEDNATSSSPLLVVGPARARAGKSLRVEFAIMDPPGSGGDAEGGGGDGSGGKHKLKKLTSEGGLRRAKGSERWNQPRMSLLGKPLNYKAHKRDARYRRVQAKIYNFLERPKDWRAISYHLLVFLMVFICLLLSIFATIRQYEAVSGQLLYYLEVGMVLWFTVEYTLRLWSAGCRYRYQECMGRLRFARKPLCIVDIIVITASIIILCLEGSGQVFATSALRGLRFFQILRMVRVDRRGGSWKLLGSVVWAHRQELFTTLYIGFLGLIFSSFLVYLAEKEKNKEKFGTYADALWWGVITLCTVGYGDAVPITWAGKLIAAFCAILGISFFALPAGILGSGFALKVQQQQRQKHLIRRRVPAASLIQSIWRCYAADENSLSVATWKPHLKPCRSPSSETKYKPARARPPTAWYKMKEVFKMSFTASSDDDLSDEEENKFKHNSSFMSRLSTRRKERSHSTFQGQSQNYNTRTCMGRGGSQQSLEDKDSDEPIRWSGRRHAITESETLQDPNFSSLRKKYSQKYDCYRDSDDEEEPERLSELTDVHKRAIRAVRKIKYFVARRKFKEAFRPYDVKDVIEQYSAGHIDMLSRVKSVQCRLDLILGKSGSKKADVYESKISVASRIVKVERQVEDIETKIDLLIELFKEDRKQNISTSEGNNLSNQNTPHYPRLRSILTEKNGSEPCPPLMKNPSRPIFRNHSDLGPRLRKKVTYRNSQGAYFSESEPSTPVSILKKGSVSSVPSEPDIHEGEDQYDNNHRAMVADVLATKGYHHTDSTFANMNKNHNLLLSQSNGKLNTQSSSSGSLDRTHVPVKRSSSDTSKRYSISRDQIDLELGEKDSEDSDCTIDKDTNGRALLPEEGSIRSVGASTLEMITEREPTASHHSSVHSSAESVVLAPHNELFISEMGSSRSERYPSYNSTESEYMSDREDSPIMDGMSETTPLNSAYESSSETTPHRQSGRNESNVHTTVANNQSSKINHLKPESQGLLMRPEVLKLRKTSC